MKKVVTYSLNICQLSNFIDLKSSFLYTIFVFLNTVPSEHHLLLYAILVYPVITS